jgi:hypothetical protein
MGNWIKDGNTKKYFDSDECDWDDDDAFDKEKF